MLLEVLLELLQRGLVPSHLLGIHEHLVDDRRDEADQSGGAHDDEHGLLTFGRSDRSESAQW